MVEHRLDPLTVVHERLVILPTLVDAAMFDVLGRRAILPGAIVSRSALAVPWLAGRSVRTAARLSGIGIGRHKSDAEETGQPDASG